jgi:hypothetical protein
MDYYYKFIRNYGKKVAPLIMLLKNEAFSWTQEATQDFEKIKESICRIPILYMLNFTFVLLLWSVMPQGMALV